MTVRGPGQCPLENTGKRGKMGHMNPYGYHVVGAGPPARTSPAQTTEAAPSGGAEDPNQAAAALPAQQHGDGGGQAAHHLQEFAQGMKGGRESLPAAAAARPGAGKIIAGAVEDAL